MIFPNKSIFSIRTKTLLITIQLLKLLFNLFGKERVEAELEKFLEFDFFPRVGGGIGMTRMIAAIDTQPSYDPNVPPSI